LLVSLGLNLVFLILLSKTQTVEDLSDRVNTLETEKRDLLFQLEWVNDRGNENFGHSYSSDISLEMYQQLEHGMEYLTVTEVLGMAGEDVGVVNVPGSFEDSDEIPTTSCIWKSRNGGNILAQFQNEKLTLKVQSGLK